MEAWYKNAFFYGVEVGTYKDGNGDGIGDFVGLTEKLDYIADLGISCVWLLPFYPSPQRDGGYDIADYTSVDPRFGTISDFQRFVQEAAKRNIRVIIDLVLNHTSDEHSWFQKARKNEKSRYRTYYAFTKDIPDAEFPHPAFPGIEPGVWAYDGIAKSFYYHRFYRFEPDLNLANRNVRKEIFAVIDFWLSYGIAGFRIDAATMIFNKRGIPGTKLENGEAFLKELHMRIKRKNDQAIMLGEADVTSDKVDIYFGSGDRMQMLYSFLLNRYLFLALARMDASPIRNFLKKLPRPPISAQWINFLRNHDELNIEQLTQKERDEVFEEFGSEKDMQAYGRGIRRRIAPMFGGDQRRIKMAQSLLFTLPGAPLLLYGDEVGLGDDLRLPERMSVRIPMQWNSEKNGGFSQVNPNALYRNVVADGPFRFDKVNVESQKKDEGSILNHVKHLATIRKFHPEIGHGAYKVLDAYPKTVLVFGFDYHGKTLITMHNLSPKGCKVLFNNFKLAIFTEVFSDGEYFRKERAAGVPIHGYGFRWFYVASTS